MGMTAHLCDGGGTPTEPVGPPPRSPRPGRPCSEKIRDIKDIARIKVNLYDYLFDNNCPVAKAAQNLPSDAIADKLALAFVYSLFNVAESYDQEDRDALAIHDKFGMGVIAQMLGYFQALEKTIQNDGLVNPFTDEGSKLIEEIDSYVKTYPFEYEEDITDIAVLISRCYVKAINEIKATAKMGDLHLAHHHIKIAFDIVLRAMQLFGNRDKKPD